MEITRECFVEHLNNQKELGEEEYRDFINDYPLIAQGIFDEKEFEQYKNDMSEYFLEF